MKKKLTFLLNYENKIGGTEKATIDLANFLSMSGYSVVLVYIYKSEDNTNQVYSFDENLKINYVYKRSLMSENNSAMNKVVTYISKKKINKVINKTKPDIVFYTDIKTIPFYSEYSFEKILMIHYSYEHYNSGTLTRKLFAKHYRNIDKVIFLSKNDLEKYKIEFKINNGYYVHNISSIKPAKRTKYDSNCITYIGRLNNKQKQLDQALKVIDNLVKKGIFSDWIFQIYGSGPDEILISKIIEKLNLSRFVKLMGPTNKVMKVLSNSDMMILTSDYEGLPMSLIEGASCGLPIISYNCASGINDIIVDSFNGFVVEKNNIYEFTQKVAALIQDKDLRKKLGSNSVELMQKNFSREKIYNEWSKILG